MVKNDTYFMKFAISQAKLAKENNEVPVGAVIVYENNIISRAHNMVELLNDSTAHAEILAITSASDYLNSKYLQGCTLYTTLELRSVTCPSLPGHYIFSGQKGVRMSAHQISKTSFW